MKLILSLLSILILSSCVSNEEHRPRPKALTVMTYNVENLFDSLDDPGKDDETYLPIADKRTAKHRQKCGKVLKPWWRKQCLETDWSESKIKRKLGRLAKVIKQVKQGKGPDVLVLQEVENLNILERLRLNHLAGLGYHPAILIEGPDARGIDVAMLSKLPLVDTPKLNEVKLDYYDRKTGLVDPTKKARPTRGILQARFGLPNGDKLTVLGVHFPSQGAPTPARRKAIAVLEQVRAKLPKSEYVIATGDFNISTEEDVREGLVNELAKSWRVSHRIGCEKCLGTHNYRGGWSFLDMILFSKNFGDGWFVDTKSIRIPNNSVLQVNHWGGPARFNDGLSQRGVSDHWPLAADILPSEVK